MGVQGQVCEEEGAAQLTAGQEAYVTELPERSAMRGHGGQRKGEHHELADG